MSLSQRPVKQDDKTSECEKNTKTCLRTTARVGSSCATIAMKLAQSCVSTSFRVGVAAVKAGLERAGYGSKQQPAGPLQQQQQQQPRAHFFVKPDGTAARGVSLEQQTPVTPTSTFTRKL